MAETARAAFACVLLYAVIVRDIFYMTATRLNNIFADNVRLYRNLQRMSCLELSRQTGIHVSQLNRWEAGKIIPKTKYLILLAEVLKVNVWELFYDGTVVLYGDEKLQARPKSGLLIRRPSETGLCGSA